MFDSWNGILQIHWNFKLSIEISSKKKIKIKEQLNVEVLVIRKKITLFFETQFLGKKENGKCFGEGY